MENFQRFSKFIHKCLNYSENSSCLLFIGYVIVWALTRLPIVSEDICMELNWCQKVCLKNWKMKEKNETE